VFVDGDLWHGNPEEIRRRGRDSLADLFPTRTDWWVAKIERTVARDREVTEALERSGWTVIRLWEHDVLRDPTGSAETVRQAVPKPPPKPRRKPLPKPRPKPLPKPVP
jgi:DNA mismatch endonuclease (patch repair protein)